MYQGKHAAKKEKPVKKRREAGEQRASDPEDAQPAGGGVAVASRRDKKVRKTGKMKKGAKAAVIIGVILALLAGMYCTFVFSQNKFITKWRTIYIETALSTMSHQWLATSFIPKSVVDDVRAQIYEQIDSQKNLSSKWWGSVDDDDDDEEPVVSSEKEAFYKTYWELDETEFEAYLEKHPELLENGYSGIVIDNLDCSDKTLKNSLGEIIRALNVPDNIIITQVTGNQFVGALACIKNPEQVSLDKAEHYGSYGGYIEEFCKNKVLAINASGFRDAEGVGNGGKVVGSYVLDGEEYGDPVTNYLFFGFKDDNRLYINWGIKDKEDYKWAMQFSPALIVNGESQVKGSSGWGMQPRSALGQTKDGEVLMLVVDGRQMHSMGCTVEDCANILLDHKAYQAANLDGGSSSIMAYQGKIITKSSSPNSNGRCLPNALVVSHP